MGWEDPGTAGEETGCELLLLVLTAASEGSGAGVMLFRGRGWYPRVTVLLDSTVAAVVALVVVATDPEDPELVHASNLGLRSVSTLAPGDPLLRAWLEWVPPPLQGGSLPPPPALNTLAAINPDSERGRLVLLKRGLSRREAEVALLAGKGLANYEIAQQLHLSEITVKSHLRRVYHKLQVDRRGGLLALFQ